VTQMAIALLAMLLACALTAAYLARASKLEPPSERGMHTVPVPSGAGVAMVATILILWPLSQRIDLGGTHILLIAALGGLTVLSWFDDRHQLPPGLRLAAHILVVALLLGALPTDERIAPAVPLIVERVVVGAAWVWFINLYNFMDGIDGIAGSEGIAVAAGYAAVLAAAPDAVPAIDLALIIAAACAGYLVWNWHPARVFMGDAGSIALGFLLGWLMIDLALRGHWAAALILPATFTADATLTLLARLWRGEKPWKPHREHFYQRAVLGGAPVPTVVGTISATNGVLIVLAVLSVRYPLAALIAGAAVVLALLAHLQHLAGKRGAQTRGAR
jgi:UDP-N-acetylmuramyl pentapeptide phosphotransferase/UDP-N-acetylglucosamine-1-phosphate transferase